ncbi:MAG: hypothetical protein CM1200mP29_16380 [Verrucomicrobiota bacterium]|nr:MAG: hypothetical protein CM1200mP29_16380 [Verrucomicrobiota bacterium]
MRAPTTISVFFEQEIEFRQELSYPPGSRGGIADAARA